jgi:hypothetical protein
MFNFPDMSLDNRRKGRDTSFFRRFNPSCIWTRPDATFIDGSIATSKHSSGFLTTNGNLTYPGYA